jgi:hypothetical protein
MEDMGIIGQVKRCELTARYTEVEGRPDLLKHLVDKNIILIELDDSFCSHGSWDDIPKQGEFIRIGIERLPEDGY